MSSIYLIRHGQASFGSENYDQLSDLGELQATRLGQVLSQRLPLFDAVVMGSLHRHRQTAEKCLAEFAQNTDQPDLEIDSGWNEYDHQNVLAQLRPELAPAASTNEFLRQFDKPQVMLEKVFVEAMDRWMNNEDDSSYTEPWSAFSERVQAALQKTLSKPAKNIAVFTSGGPISLVAQSLLGVPYAKIMDMNWTLMNCGVTKLVATSSRVFVSSLNEHTHFEGLENKHFITYS